MNKLSIVVLAVCLISVHAFVKRDAPAAGKGDNYLDNIKKQFEDLSKQVSEKFDAEEIKKGWNEAITNINKAFEDLKAKPEPAKQ